MESEHLYTDAEGNKIYSTERKMTPEEADLELERVQDRDHKYALWLEGKGPHPDQKDNAVEFPKPEQGENTLGEKRAA